MKVAKTLRKEQEKNNSVRYEVVDTNVPDSQGNKEIIYVKKTDLAWLIRDTNVTGFPEEIEISIEVTSS